jgi:hypothetical protein
VTAEYAAAVVSAVNKAITALVEFARTVARTQSTIQEPPDEFSYLWRWICELSMFRPRARTMISPRDILAWATGCGVTIEPFEFDALLKLDAAYLENLPKQKGR